MKMNPANTLTLAFLLVIGTVKAQLTEQVKYRLAFVLDSTCAKYHIKGASASVYVPNTAIWNGTYGISSTGVPVSTGMIFGIGSNTKTFTSALMLLLQEEGKISLDDTIGTWIKNKPNISGKITIRQLLNHTSGLYSFTDNKDWIDSTFSDFSRIWKPEEVFQFILQPSFAPGKGLEYSNTNYVLAGMIIEQVTHKPYLQVLKEKILSPQGLNHTFLLPEETPNDTMAHPWGYEFDWHAPIKDLTTIPGFSLNSFYSSAWSAGSLFSTAEDNARFWSNLLSGKIISQASLQQFKQYHNFSFGVGYGLGVFRYKNFDGRNIYSHGGTGFGFINENLVDSVSGVAISVMTNQDSVDNNTVLGVVVRALHKVSMQYHLTGIKTPEFSEFSIYPNPSADGRYTISFNNQSYGNALITAYDLSGKIVYQSRQELTPAAASVDLSALKSGAYIILIQTQEGILKKVVVRE